MPAKSASTADRSSFADTQTARALGVSVIYQDFALVQHLSVAENLFLGRELISSLGLDRLATNPRGSAPSSRSPRDRHSDHGESVQPEHRAAPTRRNRQGARYRREAAHPRRADRIAEPRRSRKIVCSDPETSAVGRWHHLRQSPARRNRAARRSGDGAARRPFSRHLSGRSAGSPERRGADHRP